MTITLTIPRTESAATLRLRPWRLEDLPALLAAHRDPVLRRRLATSLSDESETRRWLDAQAAGWRSATRFSFAAVAEDDDRTPLGHIVLKVVTAGVAEVGYWTAAQARGRGIATRSPETASEWALRRRDLVRLTCLDLLHAEDNPASRRVAEKCGYVLHDLLPPSPPAFPVSGHRHVRTPPAKLTYPGRATAARSSCEAVARRVYEDPSNDRRYEVTDDLFHPDSAPARPQVSPAEPRSSPPSAATTPRSPT